MVFSTYQNHAPMNIVSDRRMLRKYLDLKKPAIPANTRVSTPPWSDPIRSACIRFFARARCARMSATIGLDAACNAGPIPTESSEYSGSGVSNMLRLSVCPPLPSLPRLLVIFSWQNWEETSASYPGEIGDVGIGVGTYRSGPLQHDHAGKESA